MLMSIQDAIQEHAACKHILLVGILRNACCMLEHILLVGILRNACCMLEHILLVGILRNRTQPTAHSVSSKRAAVPHSAEHLA